MMIACEFAEFGVDPHLIAAIVQRHWRMKGNLFQAIDLTQRFPGDDFLVAVRAHFMSWNWSRGKKFKQTATEISVSEVLEPVLISFFRASQSKAFLEELQKAGQRFFVFNLSAQVRAVERALSNGTAPESEEK
jgi:hypothetical protein